MQSLAQEVDKQMQQHVNKRADEGTIEEKTLLLDGIKKYCSQEI